MSEIAALTPAEAEAVVEERIEIFGLGVLPRVRVTERPDGKWHVTWDQQEAVVEPMSHESWRAWLETNVGWLDPGNLETTES
jgi:hypothetical protein